MILFIILTDNNFNRPTNKIYPLPIIMHCGHLLKYYITNFSDINMLWELFAHLFFQVVSLFYFYVFRLNKKTTKKKQRISVHETFKC